MTRRNLAQLSGWALLGWGILGALGLSGCYYPYPQHARKRRACPYKRPAKKAR